MTGGANYTKTPPPFKGENVPKWWTPGNMCQSVCYMWLVGGVAMPEIWKGIYVSARDELYQWTVLTFSVPLSSKVGQKGAPL